MKIISTIIAITINLFLTTSAFANSKEMSHIICSQITGSHTYYFTQNSAGKENERFFDAPDSITDTTFNILFNKNTNQGLITISKIHPDEFDVTHSTEITKVFSDNQQITFLGILNNAPIMLTFYPASNVLIYNMQSNWGTIASGIRAQLFHAKCEAVS